MSRHVCRVRSFRAAACLVLLFAAGCGGNKEPQLIAEFPMDDDVELLASGKGVEFEADRGADGGGSLHLFVEGEQVFNLYEFEPGPFDGNRLVVKARMRTEALYAHAHLDLWLFRPDHEPRWVRTECEALDTTIDWTDIELAIPLLPDESPQRIRIAMWMKGIGHLWIDDLRIYADAFRDAAGRE